MDSVFNQYNQIQQEQISSPYLNKPKKSNKTNLYILTPVIIRRGSKKPSNISLQNKPVFNASLLTQSLTPKPKSTTEKNKSSNPTFTLASNNILSR